MGVAASPAGLVVRERRRGWWFGVARGDGGQRGSNGDGLVVVGIGVEGSWWWWLGRWREGEEEKGVMEVRRGVVWGGRREGVVRMGGGDGEKEKRRRRWELLRGGVRREGERDGLGLG